MRKMLSLTGPQALGAALGLAILGMLLAPVRLAFGVVGMAVVGAVLVVLVGALGLAMLACGVRDPRPVLVRRRR